jgi:phosphoribosyl 1,2-cyclic phosphodiesterase
VQIVEDGAEYEVGSFIVTPFNTPHDVASFGFRLTEQTENKSLTYATDTGCVTRKMLEYFEGSELAVIEANHDKDMLINGIYPEFLKQRILSDRGHLSNDIAARFALWLAESGTREAILAHLSKDNNTETCVRNVVCETLSRNNVADFNFTIARANNSVGIEI